MYAYNRFGHFFFFESEGCFLLLGETIAEEKDTNRISGDQETNEGREMRKFTSKLALESHGSPRVWSLVGGVTEKKGPVALPCSCRGFSKHATTGNKTQEH